MKFKPTAEGMLLPLFPCMESDGVTEIMLNEPGVVFVERFGSVKRIALPMLNERYLYQLFRLIANESSQVVNGNNPMLAARLFNGARIQCVVPPLTRWPAFCIRLKSLNTPSISQYAVLAEPESCERVGVVEPVLEQLVQQSIQRGDNMVICGATGSGKTTFVNACIQLMDSQLRVITIEDTPELCCTHPNYLSLLTFFNPESGTTIDYRALVKLSLRLRPDRIIIGEIRGDEVVDFIKACNTGHKGSLTSIHANGPQDALLRLRQLYLSCSDTTKNVDVIDAEIRQAIDLVLHISKLHGNYNLRIYAPNRYSCIGCSQ